METKLSTISVLILVLSIAVAFFIIGDGNLENIGFGIALIFQGIVALIILQSFAEVIRILKKIANIPYEGKISGEERHDVSVKNEDSMELVGTDGVKCNKCDTEYSIKNKYCPKCNSINEYYE